jgi:hypothetical protein
MAESSTTSTWYFGALVVEEVDEAEEVAFTGLLLVIPPPPSPCLPSSLTIAEVLLRSSRGGTVLRLLPPWTMALSNEDSRGSMPAAAATAG